MTGSRRNRKRKGGCLKWFLLIILFLVIGIVAVGAKLYLDMRKVTETVFVEPTVEVTTYRQETVDVASKDPFSILILGIDTGDFGRTDQGRSDVMMVATLNPNTNQTTLVSIPRDSYTEIIGRGTQDKINHAYAFGGASMAINTVQNLLDIPIDYYVTIDMGGFSQIINAVGGVDIVANDTFTNSGYSFVEGQSYHMDGDMALAYSRDRSVEGGDYGRQARQRQVIQSIASSVLSLNLVSNYQSILETLQGNVEISMPLDQILSAAQNYRSALGNLTTIQLSGQGEMLDGVYYEMLDETQLEEVKTRLKESLALD